MSIQYKTLDQLLSQDISGKTVLIRCDLNVPVDKKTGEILDSGRIDASVPTLEKLGAAQAKVVILSHLGRPDGQANPALSLSAIAHALTDRLGKTVHFAQDTIGQDALARVEGLLPGDYLLLENVRFDAREMSKDAGERQQYARAIIDIIGDDAVFVSDGFGVVHRKQASVYDIAEILPAYAGLLISAETAVLQQLLEHPAHPYVEILGGANVSDKLGVIESLAPLVDTLLIVGGMTYTFLAAQGYEIGDSLVEPHFIDSAKDLLARYPQVIHLPLDTVVADAFAADAHTKLVSSTAIPANMMGLDIGPATVEAFSQIISTAKTIFWNGPAGVFEMEPFSRGTLGIAQAIISASEKNSAFSVIGGGDSAAAVRALGLDETKFSHISTGGGASLEFLEGKTLPGLAVLETK